MGMRGTCLLNFSFAPITDGQIRIIATWRYKGAYAFYDWTGTPEEFFDGLERNRIQAVLDDGRAMVGYFGFTSKASTIELGLGLRPDLAGNGLGLRFVCAGLEFGRDNFAPTTFRLEVASFNERAIRVYERAAFQRGRSFSRDVYGKETDFVEMTRSA